jgi:hypothetical protein
VNSRARNEMNRDEFVPPFPRGQTRTHEKTDQSAHCLCGGEARSACRYQARVAARSHPHRGALTYRASYLADERAECAQSPRLIQLQSTLRTSVRLLGSVVGSTSGTDLPCKASAVEPVNPSKIAVKAKTGQSQ